jgi:AraC-like DNA-binding protein
MSTVLFDTRDLGEAEEVISANFSRVTLARSSSLGPTRTRVVRSSIGSLLTDDSYVSYDSTYQMDSPEKVLLSRVYTGVIHGQQPGHQREVFRRGQVAAIGALDGLPFFGANCGAHQVLLSVDRHSFGEVAAGSKDGEPVRLTGQSAVSATANQLLVDVVDHIYTRVATDPVAAQSPLIAGAVRRYLAAAMLATFPNTALLEPTIADRRDTTPELLRRAMAFIDDNSQRDISVAEIASAIFVTPRALQYMFRKHRDCTPLEYLRRVRLHDAHLDLLTGNRATNTVSEVARRWGFGHLGRFAVHYREHYGESPHETLRR